MNIKSQATGSWEPARYSTFRSCLQELLIITCGWALILVLAIAALFWWGGAQGRKFDALEIGQSRAECEAMLGAPWRVVSVGNCEVRYFWTSTQSEPYEISTPVTVSVIRELPWHYDTFQLFFDIEDKLVAYDWMGEGKYIHTTSGSFEEYDYWSWHIANELAALCDCEPGPMNTAPLWP